MPQRLQLSRHPFISALVFLSVKKTLRVESSGIPPAKKIPLPLGMKFPSPEIYEPQEDSSLLLGAIRKLNLSGKLACDMGTGSGILANELAKRFGKVIAVDVNPEALKSDFAKNVVPIESDLFANVKEKKFDLIVFNSPYLPGEEDARWSCGDGTVLATFLKQAKGRLSEKGRILFLLSSLTPQVVSETARKLFKRVEIVAEERLPGFETIFVLELGI
jgi:release factor glutamine methyltransferase